jgi:CRP-like cAMP-binding protein
MKIDGAAQRMRMDRESGALGCLLDCLPDPVRFRLLPDLQRVELPAGRVLQETRVVPTHVHFIRSGFVSMSYVTANGESGEIASVGNEGMVGAAALLGDGVTTGTRAVVLTPGEAYALRAEVAMREFRNEPAFQAMVMRHVRWMFSQFAQAAICSRHHPIERQLARWLLLGFDRTRDAPLLVTHETLASLLGVRREGVTEAARRLQDSGAISYSRGCIRLEERGALEQRACECYALLRDQHAALSQCTVAHGAAETTELR